MVKSRLSFIYTKYNVFFILIWGNIYKTKLYIYIYNTDFVKAALQC